MSSGYSDRKTGFLARAPFLQAYSQKMHLRLAISGNSWNSTFATKRPCEIRFATCYVAKTQQACSCAAEKLWEHSGAVRGIFVGVTELTNRFFRFVKDLWWKMTCGFGQKVVSSQIFPPCAKKFKTYLDIMLNKLLVSIAEGRRIFFNIFTSTALP